MTATVPAIVVGIDPVSPDQDALLWAAAEAGRTRRPLLLLGTYRWGLPNPWTGTPDPSITTGLRAECAAAVETAARIAAAAFPAVEVRTEIAEADAREALYEWSTRAPLVVVGTRHLSALGRVTLGSVSSALAARAECPVVVVCGPSGMPAERPAVVVGVSGDPGAEAVLEFAFREAEQIGARLHAVLCWRPDDVAAGRLAPQQPVPERAERWLTEALSGYRTEHPDVDVHAAVVRDHAVAGLVSAARSQHLLVVGRRSRANRFGSLLGSVSQGVLHHSTCPVAIIPVPRDGR